MLKACFHPTCPPHACLRAKKEKKPVTKIKKEGPASDASLWKVFSEYIRLRDSDVNGICKCITCNFRAYYRQMDCGHGIGRQHWGTRYDEHNNHAQCKKCNGFEGGRMDVYRDEVIKRYGGNAWALLELKSKSGKRLGQFEMNVLRAHYKKQIEFLKSQKNL